MERIRNKKILITGASSGIGAATAKILAKEGAILFLLARNEVKLQQICDEIISSGGTAYSFPTDVTDYKQVIATSDLIKKEHGTPDILLNNAGSGQWKFIEDTSYEEVKNFMAVPYFGAFYLTKAFLPEMKKRNSGQIINMTSYAGFIPFSGATAYIAARKAMIGFHEALNADLYHTKIKCSLAYFAKVQSTYWQHNDGSEERLPTAQILIPVIKPEQAALAILKGIKRNRSHIYTPFMIAVMNFFIQYTPRITRFIILKTGFYKK